ncbi:helix-turn-helix domain-containing protein [Methylobacterium oryzae CBMB20]
MTGGRSRAGSSRRQAGKPPRLWRLRPALRSILSALCAVWGEQAWERLIVWPSNEHLCGMTGLSERALRYGLRDLVALEVITPRDSANGKRFAIRASGGAIIDAYGFDLTPIVARRGEWASAILEATARDAQRRRSFDLLTIRRRAVSEALGGLLTKFPRTDAADLLAAQESLERSTPKRRSSGADPDIVLEAWGNFR